MGLDDANNVSATDCQRSAQDQTYGVGDNLEYDDPPRVGNFDTRGFGLNGVFDDGFNLFFVKFNLHGVIIVFRLQRYSHAGK